MAASSRTSTLQVRFEVDGDGKVVRAFTGVAGSAEKATREIDQFNDRSERMISNAKLAGAAIGAALAGGIIALGGAVKNSIDFADQLNDINQRLGISAETLGGWSYAAQQTGTDIQALGGSFKFLARNMAAALDPKSSQAGLFKALGIDVVDATGKLKTLEQMVPEVADAFKSVEDPVLKTSLAMELLGKNGAAAIEFFNQGSEGLAQLQQRAAELGFTLSQETLAGADQFNDSLNDLQTVTQGLTMQLAQALLPTLNDLVEELVAVAKDGSTAAEVGRNVGDSIEFIAAVTSRSLAQLDGFGKIIEGITAGFWDLVNVSDALIGGNFQLAMNLIRNSESDALIGQGFGQMVTGKRAGGGAAAPAVKVNFAGRDPEPEGLFKKSAAEARAEQRAADVEKRLQEYLKNRNGGGSSGRKSGGGLSDAAREAQQLDRAYQSLNASLAQELALMGATTEEAKVRWEVESGALAKLDPARKQELIQAAQKLDLSRQQKEVQDAADKAAQQESERIADGIKATDELIADMEFELSLMGMTNDERERAIALRHADANATEEQRARIAELSDERQRAQKVAEGWDVVERSLADALFATIKNAGDAKSIAEEFFDTINDYILRSITEGWAESIAGMFRGAGAGGGGAAGGGTGGGGWMAMISNLAGALFGGGRASGGSVSGGRMGRMYEVNELGVPELLNVAGRQLLMMPPGASGQVTPLANGQAGAMAGSTYNINIGVEGSVDRRTRSQIASETAQQLRISGRNG